MWILGYFLYVLFNLRSSQVVVLWYNIYGLFVYHVEMDEIWGGSNLTHGQCPKRPYSIMSLDYLSLVQETVLLALKKRQVLETHWPVGHPIVLSHVMYHGLNGAVSLWWALMQLPFCQYNTCQLYINLLAPPSPLRGLWSHHDLLSLQARGPKTDRNKRSGAFG